MSEVQKITMVYLGTYVSSKKQRSHVYININDIENDGAPLKDKLRGRMVNDIPPSDQHVYLAECSHWFSKPLGACPVGGLCEADRDGKTFRNFRGYIGSWENREDRARWQANTRTHEIDAKRESAATKDKYKDVEEYIMNIRKIYTKMSFNEKTSFLAYVIHKLTSATGK